VETGCQGGQGSPRAVAPGGWMDGLFSTLVTLVNTNYALPDDGVTAPKHVGVVLM